MSVDKKIEIERGDSNESVKERKELIFFNDKPEFRMGDFLELLLRHWVMASWEIVKATLNDYGPTIVHPNLLPLLAYYHSRDEKLMLYTYAMRS
ncbi:hypothetical protein VNO78_21917 [Psophocarpus tetragonolobus]|uniref:Uncharacterized protein n=1 Tax=Psophocarpus tetragonolobus TaxID=3891 RepID=A0AAN9SBV1_PSOTE